MINGDDGDIHKQNAVGLYFSAQSNRRATTSSATATSARARRYERLTSFCLFVEIYPFVFYTQMIERCNSIPSCHLFSWQLDQKRFRLLHSKPRITIGRFSESGKTFCIKSWPYNISKFHQLIPAIIEPTNKDMNNSIKIFVTI